MAVDLRGKFIDDVGDPLVSKTIELWEAANWETPGARTASTTTDSDGLWAFDTQDATKTWIVVGIDNTKKYLLDSRNRIQLTKLDLITDMNVNTINEHTAGAGVTIDSVVLKDGVVAVGDVAFDDATSNPLIDGTAADGSENSIARKDHVHPNHHDHNGARVHNSANISVSNATNTDMTYDTERHDDESFHSTSSNTERLTIPSGKGGDYFVSGHVQWAANGTGYRVCGLLLNGTTWIARVTEPGALSGDVTEIFVSTVYRFAAADYVTLRVYQNSGGALNVTASGNRSPEMAISRLT
jgi:hypothetical protein